jgi:hypothetical protein
MKSRSFTLFIWVIFTFNASVVMGIFPFLFTFFPDFLDKNWIIILLTLIVYFVLTVFLDMLLKKKREQLKEGSKNDLSKMQD